MYTRIWYVRTNNLFRYLFTATESPFCAVFHTQKKERKKKNTLIFVSVRFYCALKHSTPARLYVYMLYVVCACVLYMERGIDWSITESIKVRGASSLKLVEFGLSSKIDLNSVHSVRTRMIKKKFIDIETVRKKNKLPPTKWTIYKTKGKIPQNIQVFCSNYVYIKLLKYGSKC